jgi:hypothetical protein
VRHDGDSGRAVRRRRAAVAATLQASVSGSGAVGERWCGRARARLNELKWRGEKRKGNT